MCAENFLLYRAEGHPEVRAVIPRRTSLSGERGVLLTAACQMKTKAGFFIFVQASLGGCLHRAVPASAPLPGAGRPWQRVPPWRGRRRPVCPPCYALTLPAIGTVHPSAERVW